MKRTLSPIEKTARAFVPGHITGFFRIFDGHPDPLCNGSKGAGFSISAGTCTTVRISEPIDPMISVFYNGKPIDAIVTRTVVRRLMESHAQTLHVEVTHQSDLPIGVGFGASGAGALGTALALSSLIDPDSDYIFPAQQAHIAEVVNHAGLGDVIAQTIGGVEIRTREGAPGIGTIQNVDYGMDQTVVLAGRTGLETKSILTDPNSRQQINRCGDSILSELTESPSFEELIHASRTFANEIGLMTPRIRTALGALQSAGFDLSSMVMLGDSVFCFCDAEHVPDVKDILVHYWDSQEILVTTIAQCGGVLRE